MKPVTLEWVKKAEADFESADLELGVTGRRPNYDLICFLSQQSVEKYLKATLQEYGIDFPKVHDLTVLLDFALDREPFWEAWRKSFNRLKGFAVEFRYPGEDAEGSDAAFAFKTAKSFRSIARETLDLEHT
jgi:HEPN domain-containing protein